ncbi:hypothetical protein IJH27_01420 [Candidatus Saccharibacteria bacterium]|nr:hypothetical protein [Candidatus Saccharibacteria bacterium]MBQ3464474.1 hypothetical protein [Candidatus Saccharibacteria bacterium]
MEKKILEYEKFIAKEVKTGKDKREVFKYHAEMVRNFQKEREIHLIIMLFFVFLTVILVFGTIIVMGMGGVTGDVLVIWGVVDLIMVGMSVAYVRHYYFLENHVQGLYKWFKELG